MVNKKSKYIQDDKETDDSSGQGGQAGDIVFKDFLNSGMDKREDLLTGDEKRKLLLSHQETHVDRVKKQKETIDQRNAAKEGKAKTYQQGLQGSNLDTNYKAHPALADKAQFSGIDKQVTPNASENISEANAEKREELKNDYRQKYQPDYQPNYQPQFNPKPQGY